MARVQVIMPVILDGFLSEKNEELMEWLRTDRNGFSYWEERGVFNMFPHYGMIGTFIKYYKISQLIHTQNIAN